jgi:hypothetical protein
MTGRDKPETASVRAPEVSVHKAADDERDPPQPDDAALPGQRDPVVPAAAEEASAEDSAEDEVVRLRTEVAEMRSQLAAAQKAGYATPAGPASAGRTGGWRPWVAGFLIAVGALLAPLSIVAMWAHDEVADTDRYVASVAPLASDPAVQDAVVDRITTEIFNRLDVVEVTQEAVDALAAQGLPPRVADNLGALATPLANGLRNFVTERVRDIITSPTFEQAWVAANREAHTQLVAVLTGEGTDTVDVSGGTVSVNLAAVIETVKTELQEAGFALAARIPEVNAQFTIFESADLAKAQTGFDILERLARGLPVIGLLLLAVAVYVARNRRRALMAAGLAVAGSMVLLGGTLNVFRPLYLDAIPSDQLPRDAAATIYDTLVSFIRLNLRAVLVVSLAVAAGAWLTGASSAAVAVRRGIAGGMSAVRGGGERAGLNTGRVGVFAYTYRTALRSAVIGIGILVYVQAAHPTGGWTLKILVFVVAALLLVELVARPETVEGAAEGNEIAGPAMSPKPT